ncbi:hypothetical protein LCGC14_1019320 [marine sediment metagenome]|uniref:Uncharacterized protein n=1 Tax=marine sediment metagenome TaxID=412755 RepID=A0A0F9NJJ5_9ZZZZ
MAQKNQDGSLDWMLSDEANDPDAVAAWRDYNAREYVLSYPGHWTHYDILGQLARHRHRTWEDLIRDLAQLQLPRNIDADEQFTVLVQVTKRDA